MEEVKELSVTISSRPFKQYEISHTDRWYVDIENEDNYYDYYNYYEMFKLIKNSILKFLSKYKITEKTHLYISYVDYEEKIKFTFFAEDKNIFLAKDNNDNLFTPFTFENLKMLLNFYLENKK